MPDHSNLDTRYFIDAQVYNCPFCNRRNVAYSVYNQVSFDWTENKACRAFFVKCSSCDKRSMHLTFQALVARQSGQVFVFVLNEKQVLDDTFFYSVPTSFFAIDERIPRVLRELLTEAEGCLKSNYLTGASACARKIVYELGVLSQAEGENYEDRIKSLKNVHAEVDPVFFDTLLTIQQVTSTKVHENSYDGWQAKHLKVILVALGDVLHEIYVVPALRADRRKAILSLKDEVVPQIQPEKDTLP